MKGTETLEFSIASQEGNEIVMIVTHKPSCWKGDKADTF